MEEFASTELPREEQVRQVELERIRLSPYQPRNQFPAQELAELADSIRAHGVIQPVVVRPSGEMYELVAGERRWRAARQAGLERIPAIVRHLNDRDAAVYAMIENLQRQDLHYLEEAEGYRRLLEDFNLTQEELARQVGKSQSAIANKLRLLKLPEPVLKHVSGISREIFSERHGRALLKLKDPAQQLEIAQTVVQEGLTVRETEELVARIVEAEGQEDPKRAKRVVGIFKDIRIFLNAFRQAVRTLRSAGIAAELDEDDQGEYIEVRVRIHKPDQMKAAR